ncbi:uncharacterized protein LOC135388660 isoform X2 [Ornithodoros turicata]|uniref:Uncharacterized protein n=2 Tax=Ornithodoros turicata TaxID=34597 RepID=A0A2R5L9J2_9ACAR
MGLKKLIKWSIMCRKELKPKPDQAPTQTLQPWDASSLHLVSSKTYLCGSRNTRRLLVLLEDLRRLYADSWAKVMGCLEKCYDVIEAQSPNHLKAFCAIILLWVKLGDTIADTFDVDNWKDPVLARVSSANVRLLRRWKDSMERTSNFIYECRTDSIPEVTKVFDQEHLACEVETATLFQVTPDRLTQYVDTVKAYSKKSPLRHKDEKKFLNTEATLTKSLSQLNLQDMAS